MKKIMAVMLSLLACTVLLAGCNTSSESNEGDILRDSDADKLTDNLWFELKTTNLSGEENTYQVQLKTTEITKEVKK